MILIELLTPPSQLCLFGWGSNAITFAKPGSSNTSKTFQNAVQTTMKTQVRITKWFGWLK